jgi:hypothetical protein
MLAVSLQQISTLGKENHNAEDGEGKKNKMAANNMGTVATT